MEYVITNEEPARFWKKKIEFESLSINLDDDKYRTRKTLFIRSGQKIGPHETASRVFLTWIILQMEINSDVKKN